jgi:hypothetical protein
VEEQIYVPLQPVEMGDGGVRDFASAMAVNLVWAARVRRCPGQREK